MTKRTTISRALLLVAPIVVALSAASCGGGDEAGVAAGETTTSTRDTLDTTTADSGGASTTGGSSSTPSSTAPPSIAGSSTTGTNPVATVTATSSVPTPPTTKPTTKTTSASSTSSPTNPSSELAIRIDDSGGFVPVEFVIGHIPLPAIYADGTAYSLGAQITIFPPPALPSLTKSRLSKPQLEALVKEAKDAGLLVDPIDYGRPGVADASTTSVTIVSGGRTFTQSAYALGIDFAGPDMTSAQRQARTRLKAFVAAVNAAVAANGTPADFDALAVFARPFGPNEVGAPPQTSVAWPLTNLATAGTEGTFSGWRCQVLTGADLATVLPLARAANTQTPFSSNGVDYKLIVRPQLPGERACTATS